MKFNSNILIGIFLILLLIFFFYKPFTIKSKTTPKYIDTTPRSIWPGWGDMYWDDWDHWKHWYDWDHWRYRGYHHGTGWRNDNCGYKGCGGHGYPKPPHAPSPAPKPAPEPAPEPEPFYNYF